MRTHLAVIVLAVTLVYANGLTGPFLPDDERAIATNMQIRQLSLAALDPPIETPVAGRPLVNLSFALNYAAGGLDVKGYHAANIALHALAALVLYGLVWRTLARSGGPRLAAAAQPVALAAALVWAVHPLNTEAVTYLTQRSELLMGLSLLLTMYCALRAADSRHSVRWTVAAVAACLAGTLSKEPMVTAPVLVVLFDRVFLYGSLREAFARRRALYLGLAANWLVLGWLMAGAPRSTVGGDATAAWNYLLNQAVLVARYLRLAVWPMALVSDYGAPRTLSIGDVVVPGAIVVALVLLTLVALWRRPRLGFLGAWVFITLAPTSTIVPIVSEVGAERRMYLPLAALAVLAVVGLFRLLVRQSSTEGAEAGGRVAVSRPWMAAIAIACVALSVGTVLRNREYRSRMTLFQANVERWPSGRSRFSLADELIKADEHNAAVEQLQAATPDYPPAYYGLATEMLGAGRVDDAAMYAREFIRLMPASPAVPTAHELIGQALLMQGKLSEAATEFTQLIDIRPNDPRPRLALGDVLVRQRKFDEAIIRYGEALDRRPGDPEILQKAGLALAAAQRLPEAAGAFDRALSGRPNDIGLLNLLGRALAAQGRYADAVGPFRRIVELAPSDPQAAENLKAMERFAAASPPKAAPSK